MSKKIILCAVAASLLVTAPLSSAFADGRRHEYAALGFLGAAALGTAFALSANSAPQPVIVPQQPVYVAPAPVYALPQGYYAAPQSYYTPPPVVYAAPAPTYYAPTYYTPGYTSYYRR